MDLMLIFSFSGHLVYGLTRVLRSIAQEKETFWASGEDEKLGEIWTISFDPVSSKLCLLCGLQVGDFIHLIKLEDLHIYLYSLRGFRFFISI